MSCLTLSLFSIAYFVFKILLYGLCVYGLIVGILFLNRKQQLDEERNEKLAELVRIASTQKELQKEEQ